MSRDDKPSDGAAGKQDPSMGCCRQAEELQSLSQLTFAAETSIDFLGSGAAGLASWIGIKLSNVDLFI